MLQQLFLLVDGLIIALGVYLVGSDKPIGWALSSIAESIWIVWAVYVGLWGMVPTAIVLLLMNLRGWYRHRNLKSRFISWENKVLSYEGSELRVQAIEKELKDSLE